LAEASTASTAAGLVSGGRERGAAISARASTPIRRRSQREIVAGAPVAGYGWLSGRGGDQPVKVAVEPQATPRTRAAREVAQGQEAGHAIASGTERILDYLPGELDLELPGGKAGQLACGPRTGVGELGQALRKASTAWATVGICRRAGRPWGELG